MRYTHRTAALTLIGVLAIGITASGCATPWFSNRTSKSDPPTPTHSPGDLKQATIGYINGLCKLPKEQRDPQFRELNESLLPNHAAISCGRGGDF